MFSGSEAFFTLFAVHFFQVLISVLPHNALLEHVGFLCNLVFV